MRILIADDHNLFRDGLQLLIESQYPDTRFSTSNTLTDAVAKIENGPAFQLIILDLHMPGMESIESIRNTCELAGAAPVMIISGKENSSISSACLAAGASAYIPKSSDSDIILSGIQAVLSGATFFPRDQALAPGNDPLSRLTGRKRKVLALLAEGCSNKEIAERLFLTEGTIKQYVSDVLYELGVDNRTQAGMKARELLLILNSQ